MTSTGKRPVPGNKGRPPKKKPTKVTRITAAQYNALWDGWVIKQTVDFAARHAKVKRETAQRYIDGPGHPGVGMEPIRERFARVMAKVREEEDLTVEKFHKKHLETVQTAIQATTMEIALLAADAQRRIKAFNDSKGQLPPVVRENMSRVAETFDRMVRLGERMLGAPDATHRHLGRDPMDQMTVEELVEYSTTGVLPERLR